MFDKFFMKINDYLERLLEKVSLKQLLIVLLFIFLSIEITVFAVSTYKNTYKTIYKERIEKIKDIDVLVAQIFDYQNSLVLNGKKTLEQAKKDSIDMIKSVRFQKDDYIWIDGYDGLSIYHPMPAHSANKIVDARISKIVENFGRGYIQYKWERLDPNKKKQFYKVSYVEGYKNWGWIIGTGVYVDDINFLVLKSMLYGVLPVILFFILMIYILRFILLKSVVKPIDELADISSRLANSDLNVVLPISKSDTELGKLYQIFNKFIDLFEKEKKTAEREALLRDITEKIRSSLNLDETLSFICDETAKLFEVQRSAISAFSDQNDYEKFIVRKEYRGSSEILEFNKVENAPKAAAYWASILLRSGKVMAFDNIVDSDTPDSFKDVYGAMGVKSIIGVSIRKEQDVWGTLVLSEYNKYRHWTDEEKVLLQTIADQVYIAINQAELFEKEKKIAEREKLYRNITETVRSTLDINELFELICSELAHIYNIQRSFIVEFKKIDNKHEINIKKEFKTGPDVRGLKDAAFDVRTIEYWGKVLLEEEGKIIIDNIEEADTPDYFIETYKNIGVKSIMGCAIKKGDDNWGWVGVSEYNYYRHWTEDEIKLLETISNQLYIAIKQAELFETTQLQAEREKLSRNIIEILRSSLDKNIIKHLFVRNIGKYFSADRVCFSDYDNEKSMYMPVAADSEYLSNPEERSLVGYDWSSEEARPFIQPLLEKREFNIFCWDEYIQDNPKGHDLVSFFESINVKSSYNLPVLYQGQIMGFFCIDFCQTDCQKLSNEDINRIRNMCTQAGIALYHADLFIKAQASANLKSLVIANIANGANALLDNILELSESMSKTEEKCDDHIAHLNKINKLTRDLLEFTGNIVDKPN